MQREEEETSEGSWFLDTSNRLQLMMHLILLSTSVSLVGEQSAPLNIVHSLPDIQSCMHAFTNQHNCAFFMHSLQRERTWKDNSTLCNVSFWSLYKHHLTILVSLNHTNPILQYKKGRLEGEERDGENILLKTSMWEREGEGEVNGGGGCYGNQQLNMAARLVKMEEAARLKRTTNEQE